MTVRPSALARLDRAMSRDELDPELLKPLIVAYAKSNPDALQEILKASRGGVYSYLDLHLMRDPLEFRITPDFRIRFSYGEVRIVRKRIADEYEPHVAVQ